MLPPARRATFTVLIVVFWAIGSILEALLAWAVMPNVVRSAAVALRDAAWRAATRPEGSPAEPTHSLPAPFSSRAHSVPNARMGWRVS